MTRRGTSGWLAIAALLWVLPGCDATDEGDDDSVTDDDDSTADDDDTGDDDSAADDDDSAAADDDDTGDDDSADDDDSAAVDCGALPAGPLPYDTLSGLYASEDFAFDDSGHMITHHGNALYRQEYPPGSSTAFAVTAGGSGGPASMRMLSTGDLVYANVDTATLYRVEPDGSTHVIYGSLGYAMGIDIHHGGSVFLSDLMGLLRFDPYTTDMDLLIGQGVLNNANGMTFSEDYSTLYFGTFDGVYSVAVDGDGTPLATPTPWAVTPAGGELLGMGVDICGNVYVIEDGRRLLRFPPGGGPPETLLEVAQGAWMTNLQWGSGIGGWDERAIYVTDRGNEVYYELAAEVPSKVY